MKYSHDYRALLTPDALGGVFCLHIGGHSILHGTRDVLLYHICTVIPAGRGGKNILNILQDWFA